LPDLICPIKPAGDFASNNSISKLKGDFESTADELKSRPNSGTASLPNRNIIATRL
jgi:hypothetical protein